MVYYRNRKFHKRPYRRNPIRKMVAKAKRKRFVKTINKQIQRRNPISYVYAENILNPTSAGVLGALVPWPAQGVGQYTNIQSIGTAQSERIKNMIDIRSLELKYLLIYGDSTNFFRVTIFQWMDNTTVSTPTPGDIYMNIPGSYFYLAHFNPYTRGKYKVLHDKLWTLSDVGGTRSIQSCKTQLAKRLRKKKVRLDGDGDTGVTGHVYSGNIYIFVSSDSGIAPNPQITYSVRLGYSEA